MAQLAYTVAQLHDKGTAENPKEVIVPWGRSFSYELINSGRLKAKRVGDKTIVLHKDIEHMLEELPDVEAK